MKLSIDKILVCIGNVCFWAVLALGFAALCGCEGGPSGDDLSFNGMVKLFLFLAAVFALVFGSGPELDPRGASDMFNSLVRLQFIRALFILTLFILTAMTLAVMLPACTVQF